MDTSKASLADTTFTIAAERQFYESLDSDPAVQAWEGYDEIRHQLATAWENLPDLEVAPQVLIHTDILFENSVRTPSGAVTLIDWDGAGIGPAIQDIGYSLVQQAVSLTGELLPLDNALAFIRGYTAERQLSSPEWDQLPDALIFGAIVYVLAPWHGCISEANWLQARYILSRGEELSDNLRQGVVA